MQILTAQIQDSSSSSYFFNEFGISGIQQNGSITTRKHKLGFGIGAYHSGSPEKIVNIVMGIEYNYNRQYGEYIYLGRFASINDISLDLHSLAIPIAARFNVAPDVLFFLEAGVFLEIPLYGRWTGTETYNVPGEPYTQKKISRSESVDPLFGPAFGLGVTIPVSNKAIVLKFDYRGAILNSQNVNNKDEELKAGSPYSKFMIAFKI